MGEGTTTVTDAKTLKEEGNKSFQSGDYNQALIYYTKAITTSDSKHPERGIFFRNRAAVYLKLENYEEAVEDANSALGIDKADVKALFRRSQAYEQLNRVNEAFKDARIVQHLDPKNSSNLQMLQKLSVKLQEISKEQANTSNKVKQMLTILGDEKMDLDKREKAANNLVVLSREKAGIEIIMALKGDDQLINLLKKSKNNSIRLSGIRILGEICRSNIEFTKMLLGKIGVPFFIQQLDSKIQEYVNSIQYWIQVIINSLSGMNMKESKKPNKDLLKENQYVIDTLMTSLAKAVTLRSIAPNVRDSILELLMKNVELDALNWGMKLVDMGGLECLLQVAGEMVDSAFESAIVTTANTRTHVAVTLDKVYWCMDHDKAREKYRGKVEDYVKAKLAEPETRSKVEVISIITTLCMGPMDVGNSILAFQGVVELMLVMAGSEDELQQKVAAEAIIVAAHKKDKCNSIATMGTSILKKLYQSKNDAIKVRGLVGLCKIASMGGTDASIKPFEESSAKKLTFACRKFLVNPSKDKDLRKWAAEGLSYLTLDADSKEELIEDPLALRALIDLARVGDLSVVYGVVVTLVNLTNSYDKEEMMPELVKLAKFAKQHVPEEHTLDHQDFVDKRIKILAENEVTTALVALAKTESQSSREMISRIFLAVCEKPEFRGMVVQQGGARTLLNLAIEGNRVGKLLAAQALSRIAISINPEGAFPGQRSCEVIRPMMTLLHPDCTGLQNFEALMGLTNLAQVSETVRTQIIKESGFPHIEHYMYEEHEMLKRAATQCILNLSFSPQVVKKFEIAESDRVKYLILLCQDEDLDTAQAAAGTLAVLATSSPLVCEKILAFKDWVETLTKLVANEDKGFVERGVSIVLGMMYASKEIGEKIVETNLMELLMAITRPEVDDISQKVKGYALDALKKAEQYGIIKSNPENNPEEEGEDQEQ